MPHEDELVPMGITKRGGPAFLKGTYTSSPPQTTQAETCGNPPNALVRVQNHRIGGASVYSPMIMLLMSTKQWRIPVFCINISNYHRPCQIGRHISENGPLRGSILDVDIPNWRTKTQSVSQTMGLVPENCLTLIPVDYHHFPEMSCKKRGSFEGYTPSSNTIKLYAVG